jgi:hypothetical protein
MGGRPGVGSARLDKLDSTLGRRSARRKATGQYRPERRKARAVVRTGICSEKSLPNCRGVIGPVVFFETESLS